MTASGYAAGWYPDPNLPPGALRWYDGNGWTEHVHPPLPAAPDAAIPAQQTAPAAAAAFEQSRPSIFASNGRSLTAIAVAAFYVYLASTTGIVLLGIVPVSFSIRAFQRHERLAPLAMAAAAFAVLFAISSLSHR